MMSLMLSSLSKQMANLFGSVVGLTVDGPTHGGEEGTMLLLTAVSIYLILNLAVGGTTGFFPDVENVAKPWTNNGGHPVNDFYNDIDTWMPTWTQGFEIDSVRVWTYEGEATNDTATSTGAHVVSTMLMILYHPGLAFICLILTAAFFVL